MGKTEQKLEIEQCAAWKPDYKVTSGEGWVVN